MNATGEVSDDRLLQGVREKHSVGRIDSSGKQVGCLYWVCVGWPEDDARRKAGVGNDFSYDIPRVDGE
mgnify:CR=1 FL=1